MTFKGTYRGAFVLASVFVIALTLVPALASAEPATHQQSQFRALDSPWLQAPSGELNGQLLPPPVLSVPSYQERSESLARTRLAELTENDGEGIYDGGGATQAQDAGTPKEARDYRGPLGGLGISCEDQKDLEALAFGTYGNVLKALAGNPSIVKCAPKSGGTDEGAVPSNRSGTSGGKGERK